MHFVKEVIFLKIYFLFERKKTNLLLSHRGGSLVLFVPGRNKGSRHVANSQLGRFSRVVKEI